MTGVTAMFWDVGGVLLTNGWDQQGRRKLAEKFNLDREDFESRHKLAELAFETGRLDLEQYLERTVFYCQRKFTRPEVKDFMFAQSQPYPQTLGVLERLARSKKYLLAALNNESLELNQYRIEGFGLRKYFTVFLSSCFLGVRKPEEAIYRRALGITQRAPEESVFVDDRELNVESARREGMHAIQFKDARRLEAELRGLGLEV